MEPSNEYQSKQAAYFSSRRDEMIGFVPLGARDILEVGCGRGGFAANLKERREVRVTGIEPFAAAAADASDCVDTVIHADVESGIRQLQPASFDCIVFNDVLEHMVNPELVLSAIAELLRPGGVVVASIPNMRYMPAFKALVLHGQWRYTEEGVLDRTHLRFFTMKSVREMFAACGYRIQRLEGINSLPYSWKYALLDVCTLGKFADTRHLQIAVVATLTDSLT